MIWYQVFHSNMNDLKQFYSTHKLGPRRVLYWPPTRPSCQNRMCTCVNNRCIRSRNIRIWPWLSRGWIECEIVTLAGREWTSNYYITLATGSSGQLEIESVGEKMLEWRPCPRDAGPTGPRLSSPGERERNAKSGGQYVAVLLSLQLTSHTVKPLVTLSNPFK